MLVSNCRHLESFRRAVVSFLRTTVPEAPIARANCWSKPIAGQNSALTQACCTSQSSISITHSTNLSGVWENCCLLPAIRSVGVSRRHKKAFRKRGYSLKSLLCIGKSSILNLISSALALSSGAYMADTRVGRALNFPGISARSR